MTRTCLHCALARALREEIPALAASGLGVTLGRSEPVWLPVPGLGVYRGLRRLLTVARECAERSPVKITIIDLPGKSHVEVTATVARGRGAQVLGCAFPRFAAGKLAGGFSELAGR